MFSKICDTFKKIRIFKEGSLGKTDLLRVVHFFLFPLLLTVIILAMTMIFAQNALLFLAEEWVLRLFLTYFFVLSFQGFIYALCHNLTFSFATTCVFFYFFEFVNQTMCFLTGDPLLPTDLVLAGSLGNIVGFVDIPFNNAEIIGLVLIALLFLAYRHFSKKIPKKKLVLWAKLLLSIILIAGFATNVYLYSISPSYRNNYLASHNIKRNTFKPIDDFYKNGGVLVFFPRIGDMFVETPDNYSKDTVSAINDKYTFNGTFGKTDVTPNVIVIQNEAWWDPTLLPNAEFSENPMALFREYEKDTTHTYTGIVESPSFGGGTCLTEFEMLTGMNVLNLPSNVYPYIQSIRGETASFVQEYKNNGYSTIALHPYKGNFYSRDTAYPLLGFDEFLDSDDMKNTEKAGWYISDDSASYEIIRLFEESKSDKKYIFTVTMQNHGGYTSKRYDSYDIDVTGENFTKDDLLCINEFTQGVYDTMNAFKILTDYFEKIQEPTIIAMYGDHLPLLADGSPYINGGMVPDSNLDNYTQGRNFYQTPYIIWANYDISGMNIPKRLSPAALGLEVFKMSGLKNIPDYYNLYNEIYKNIPVYHFKGLVLSDGTTFGDRHEEIYNTLISDYKMIQYDLLNGKKYLYK